MIADSRRRLRHPQKSVKATIRWFASNGLKRDSGFVGGRLMGGYSNPTRAGWCSRSIHVANVSLIRDFEVDAIQRVNRRIK